MEFCCWCESLDKVANMIPSEDKKYYWCEDCYDAVSKYPELAKKAKR